MIKVRHSQNRLQRGEIFGKGYGIKYGAIVKTLRTYWEHIDNIINNHWELGENLMESYGTQLGTSNSQKRSHHPQPSRGKKRTWPHVIGWVRFLFQIVVIGHHFWPRLTTRGMNCGGQSCKLSATFWALLTPYF